MWIRVLERTTEEELARIQRSNPPPGGEMLALLLHAGTEQRQHALFIVRQVVHLGVRNHLDVSAILVVDRFEPREAEMQLLEELGIR